MSDPSSLAQMLASSGRPPLAYGLQILNQLAAQLDIGHRRGFPHGAVSTEGVTVQVEVTDPPDPVDPGPVVRVTLTHPERVGAALSDRYRAPELPAGAAPSIASDLFALGVIAEELLGAAITRPDLANQIGPALAALRSPDPAARPTSAQIAALLAGSAPPAPGAAAGLTRPAATLSAVGAATDERGREPQHDRRTPRGSLPLVVGAVLSVLILGAGGFLLTHHLGSDEPEQPVLDGYGGLDRDDPPDDDVATAPESHTTPVPSPTSAATTTSAPTPAASAPASTSPPATATTAPPAAASRAPDTPALPDFAVAGWDTDELRQAYCRNEGDLVALGSSARLRGIVCESGGDFIYYALDLDTGATARGPAEFVEPEYWYADIGPLRYWMGPDHIAVEDLDVRTEVFDDTQIWLTPGSDEPFRPGDLDLDQPITYPACNGDGVVIIASFMSGADVDDAVARSLREHPSAEYLRTDLSCDNFNRPSIERSDSRYIYATYYLVGPVSTSELCSAIEAVGTYGYWLANDVPPGQPVSC